MQHIYDFFLHRVTKPARYLGLEKYPRPESEQPAISIVLCFPDVYEIGMSHLGLRLLFELLSKEKDVFADLAFAPWLDMEKELRSHQLPLVGLFSQKPLSEFDIIGFSLQTELCFSNILNMLDLCGLELQATQRTDSHPLIIAGGPVATNPAPFSEFIDAFLIGDGEEALIELVRNLKKIKPAKRSELLSATQQTGFYVPQKHQENDRIRRRWIPELYPDLNPSAAIVPILQTVQDRIALEVLRGCTQGCRFCQAGYIYRPARELSVPQLVSLAQKGLQIGYDELSLVSLSTADYSDCGRLVSELATVAAEKKAAISLPSLRADSFNFEIADYIAQVRQTGFTFAPESGSEKLRKRLNKNISDQELLEAVQTAFLKGWKLIKLYFMIGLPQETADDIEKTIQLIREIEKIARHYNRQNKIHVSFGSFIPKAHTPFQWEPFLELEKLQERLFYIKQQVSSKVVLFKWQSPEQSKIEAIISRGDQRLGKALLTAFRQGSRFESWTEQFNYQRLIKSINECGLNPDDYCQAKELDQALPWDFIDIGVHKNFLLKERNKAFLEEPQATLDCRQVGCHACGIPGNGQDLALKHRQSQNILQTRERLKKIKNIFTLRAEHNDKSNTKRYRLIYTKLGLSRFLGHSDLVRLWQMSIRAVELPVLYSKGFTPRPITQFGPVLPLGIESHAEIIDFWLLANTENVIHDKITALNQYLPTGIQVQSWQEIENSTVGSDRLFPLADFSIFFPADLKNYFQEKFQAWQEKDRWPAENRQKMIDLKTAIRSLEWQECKLKAILPITSSITDNVNPFLLLEAVFAVKRDDSSNCRIIKNKSLPET